MNFEVDGGFLLRHAKILVKMQVQMFFCRQALIFMMRPKT